MHAHCRVAPTSAQAQKLLQSPKLRVALKLAWLYDRTAGVTRSVHTLCINAFGIRFGALGHDCRTSSLPENCCGVTLFHPHPCGAGLESVTIRTWVHVNWIRSTVHSLFFMYNATIIKIVAAFIQLKMSHIKIRTSLPFFFFCTCISYTNEKIYFAF